MLVPTIPERMVQRHDLSRFRVDSRQVATFVQIAFRARQGEIVDCILTTVLTSDDVLNMQGNQGRIGLPALTILTAIVRPPAHREAGRGIRRLRLLPTKVEARFGLKHAEQIIRLNVGFVFRPLGGRQLPFVRLFSQFGHAVRGRGIALQLSELLRLLRREKRKDGRGAAMESLV
jgi:hypothetical protein